MQVSAAIFKSYDIRGIYPQSLNEDVALMLGRVLGTHALSLGEKRVAVGRDGRLSGPGLVQALMKGLKETGIEVLDIGLATTPQLYFAAKHFCTSGVQVTGSHNPRDYNGFKMVVAGRAIYGEEIQNLRREMEKNEWQAAPGGHIQEMDVQRPYLEAILADIKLARPMKVVVDSGNGVAGASAPQILRAVGCVVTELYSEVDGNFPNHHPDPSKPENLRELIEKVKEVDAELGLAFDGDGDRLGVVTKEGHLIFPDRQIMLFAQDLLEREGKTTIIFDVKCTQQLAPFIEKHGGVPLMYKTGHSLIKAKMKEVHAKLGGEMSGHIFFNDRWGFDDGTYGACRLLEILSRFDNPSMVLDALPTSFSTPELNVACAEGEAAEMVSKLQQSAPHFEGATVNTIDGLRVDWADGFGLIRASNTTPVLVLRFEGQSEAALKRIESTMLALLKSVKPDAALEKAAH